MRTAPEIDSFPISALQRRVLALCAFVALIEGFDIQAVAYVAPVLRSEVGIEAGAIGWIFGAFLTGAAAGSMVIGPLADKFGRRPLLIGSTLVFGIGAIVTIWCTSVESFLAVRFLTGLGVGGAAALIVPLTYEYTPQRLRSTAAMTMLAGLPIGSVSGGILSTWLVPAFGWQAVFLVGGVLPILTAAIMTPLLPESIRILAVTGRDSEKMLTIMPRISPSCPSTATRFFIFEEEKLSSGSRVTALFSEGRAGTTVFVWCAMFANYAVFYFLASWIPSLITAAGSSLSVAILAGTVFSLGGIAAALSLGKLMDTVARPAIVLACASTVAVVSILSIPAILPSIAPTFIAILLLGMGSGGAQLGIITLSGQLYPTMVRSTGVGWALGVGRIGSIISPVVGGLLISTGWGAEDLFSAAALPALMSLGALLALAAIRPDSRIRPIDG